MEQGKISDTLLVLLLEDMVEGMSDSAVHLGDFRDLLLP